MVDIDPSVPEVIGSVARSDAAPRAAGGARAFAAIDLGTNNCRLLVGTPSGESFRVLDSFSRTVRLGEGLQETGRLTKIPGIGKKTAERLLLELRDKLPKGGLGPALKLGAGGTAPESPADNLGDILNALLALGYNEREALSAMKTLPPDTAVADGIRAALKLLSKG